MRDVEGLHQLPGGHVAGPDVAHLAVTHQVVEAPQSLVERRKRVVATDLVEIDVIGAQALEVGLGPALAAGRHGVEAQR